ncbi:MAG: hypothetical protein J5623_07325 [Clostridiales bacterium]|nr:hypothetical protein [Clostridiales bacterium]
MNNYDDLFNNNDKIDKSKDKNKNTPFDKDAWVEKKRQERAEAYELLDEATAEIVSDGERFRDYLNTQAQFDRYSVSNALLIAFQRPGATKVADFGTWKDDDVSVNKGEKAITILEPGNEYTREDGSTGFSVNVKKVFDISQTNSDANVKRRTLDARAAIKALIASAPCAVVLVEKLDNCNARYSPDKNEIYIVKGLEANEIFRALSYEICIARAAQKDIDRKDGAFGSYCASYILCERNGFDTGDFNFDRVPERFADVDNKDVRKELGEIRDMANEISQEMNRQFEAMDKNKRSRDDGAR